VDRTGWTRSLQRHYSTRSLVLFHAIHGPTSTDTHTLALAHRNMFLHAHACSLNSVPPGTRQNTPSVSCSGSTVRGFGGALGGALARTHGPAAGDAVRTGPAASRTAPHPHKGPSSPASRRLRGKDGSRACRGPGQGDRVFQHRRRGGGTGQSAGRRPGRTGTDGTGPPQCKQWLCSRA
jgi:hypothetical protein